MTAQIIVMNMNGVAVASDTAVSTRFRGNYKSAGTESKMVKLPEPHKLVVLHSASNSINNVPHMRQLNAWANSIPKPLATVQAYVDHYLKWTATEGKVLPKETSVFAMRWILDEYFDSIKKHLRHIEEEVFALDDLDPAGKKRERNKKVAAYLRELKTNLSKSKNFKGLTREAVLRATKPLQKEIVERIDERFEKTLTPAQKKALLGLTNDVLLKQNPTDCDSTVYFVGFGTGEAYPRVRRLTTRGMYAGRVVGDVSVPSNPVGAMPKDNAVDIICIAQQDAMQGFIYGYHPDAPQAIDDAIQEHLGELITAGDSNVKLSEVVNRTVWAALETVSDRQGNPLWGALRHKKVPLLEEFARAMVTLQALSSFYRGDGSAGGEVETLGLTSD